MPRRGRFCLFALLCLRLLKKKGRGVEWARTQKKMKRDAHNKILRIWQSFKWQRDIKHRKLEAKREPWPKANERNAASAQVPEIGVSQIWRRWWWWCGACVCVCAVGQARRRGLKTKPKPGEALQPLGRPRSHHRQKQQPSFAPGNSLRIKVTGCKNNPQAAIILELHSQAATDPAWPAESRSRNMYGIALFCRSAGRPVPTTAIRTLNPSTTGAGPKQTQAQRGPAASQPAAAWLSMEDGMRAGWWQ